MIKQVIIDNFDGGIEDDVRSASTSGYACSSHWEIPQPHRLMPLRDMEAEANIGGNSIALYEMTDFLYHKYSSGENLFALGINYGTSTYPAILEKSGDVITSAFALSSSGAATGGVGIPNTLFEYKQKLYYIRTIGGATKLVEYDRATTTPDENKATFSSTLTPSGKPFHHKKSDIVYIPFQNTLSQLNVTTVTDPLTLPTTESITALADWGTYLAIGTSPRTNASSKCKISLFDMTSADISDTITIGEGVIEFMENIGGTIIVGVSSGDASGGSSFYGSTGLNKITIYAWAGGQNTQIIKQFIAPRGSAAHTLYKFTARKEDVLYFSTYIMSVNGATRSQLWTVRKNRYGRFVVEGSVLPNNDTAVSSSIRGFTQIGDYCWVSYDSFAVKRTNDQSSFTATSLYETQIFNLGDSSLTKKLLGVTVMTDPLPTAGQVVLQYRRNEETAWTDIFTHTTDNSISHSAINIESTGATLGQFKEVQFRIKSTGGAIITGLKFKVETIDNDIY